MATFDVTEVWWSGATHTTQTFDRALTALEDSEAFYEEPRAGDTTTIGGLVFEVVNPPDDADFGDLHDSGLSFRVTYGRVRLLFTGDAETPTEQRMVDRHGDWLGADIYQVGHHGSRTSTSAAFLDAVSPRVAVYSAAAGNAYGHPHPEVVERLIGAGVDLYGADVHGTVLVTSDGAGFTVTTERDAPPIAAVPDQE
jgi:competence protein ComEC